MRAVLAAGLVVSVGVNVWLLTSREPAAPVSVASVQPTAKPARREGDAPAKETEDLKARVAELEKSLAAANEKSADLDAMDPMAVLVYAKRPIAWKARKLLEIADERQRWAAMGKVAQVLGERESTGKEFLEALRTETDPKVVGMIGMLARSSLGKISAEDRRAFVDVLRAAPLAETRAAASNALFMTEQFRGGFDEKAQAVAKEMNGYLLEALRTESSPEVVGQIAQNLAAWSPSPEAVDALKSAAERLAPSPGRRLVWEAIGRGMFMGDRAALFQQFEAATAQDVKDDIAAGIARAGNSMSGGGGPGDAAKRLEEARTRFRTVFSGTSDVTVRRTLLRASLYGLGCVEVGAMQTEEQKADVVRFFRETAALESDVKQREKIEKVAAAFEQKGMGAYSDYDKIMSAKE